MWGRAGTSPVGIDEADSEDMWGKGWLNAMFLELFSRFLHNQTTYFYHTSRQIKLNIWVVSAQLFSISISASGVHCRVCYILRYFPPQDWKKPWSRWVMVRNSGRTISYIPFFWSPLPIHFHYRVLHVQNKAAEAVAVCLGGACRVEPPVHLRDRVAEVADVALARI